MNSAMCGHLTFRIGEYQVLGAAILLGVERMKGHLTDESDDSVFIAWTKRKE